ncbi:MAG: hypothetical protein HKN92_08570 [Chitinophagales bacterium]|nr:hypothetical protein [Chitinophagales bacterium]
MGIQDLILTPIYILVILLFAQIIKKRIPNPILRKYFIPGLVVKIFGALATGIIYFYYYGDGDTVYFFNRSKYIFSVLSADFQLGMKLIFTAPDLTDPETYSHLVRMNAGDTSSFLVTRVTAFIGLFTFYTYSTVAVIFSIICYSGMWHLFRILSHIYPNSIKGIAIACLFIPSVFFWGSGIFKDTITMGCLAWLTVSFYHIFIHRKHLIIHILIAIVCINMIGVIKSYILLAFIPSAVFWIFLQYKSRIRSRLLSRLSLPFVLAFSLIIGFVLINQLSSSYGKFGISNIESRATDMQRWHTAVEDYYDFEGSSYSLGAVDFSYSGLLFKIPAAINATLFRPYIWEVNNILMIFAFLESTIFLWFTLKVLLMGRFFQPFIEIFRDPTLAFCLVFSMVFAFSVGFTSYNFGALVRYKIPCLPFYAVLLVILLDKIREWRYRNQKARYNV